MIIPLERKDLIAGGVKSDLPLSKIEGSASLTMICAMSAQMGLCFMLRGKSVIQIGGPLFI
jgi:hypothetical protein